MVPRQPAEDLKHPALHGDVQRRGRLIGYQQLRSQAEGDRDQDSLLESAGEFVGVLFQPLRRTVDAHQFEEPDDLRPDLAFGALAFLRVQPEDFGNLGPDRLHRIQRGAGILRNHADLPSTDSLHGAFGKPGQLDSVERDGSGGDCGRPGEKADERFGERAFAGTGFADDGNDFARLEDQFE